MQLNCPQGVKSINVAGTEYTADAAGRVNITDPVHIDAAVANGFTEHDGIPVLDQQHVAGE